MGRRGPKPKPTNLRVLHGEQRPSRIGAKEPKPRTVAPTPPAWLSTDALAVWERTVAELDAMGLAHQADVDTFTAYCCAVVNFSRAQELVDRSSVVMASQSRGASGLMGNPASREARQWGDIMVRLAREFGLTPSARVGLDTEPEPEDAKDLARRLLT